MEPIACYLFYLVAEMWGAVAWKIFTKNHIKHSHLQQKHSKSIKTLYREHKKETNIITKIFWISKHSFLLRFCFLFIYLSIYLSICRSKYMHIYTFMYIATYIHFFTYIHINVYIYIYTYIYIHIYIYIYIYIAYCLII